MGRKAKVRPEPTAEDFVRIMEALGAYEQTGKLGDPWGKVYRLAHVCFETRVPSIPGGCCGACTHPEWVKEFWETYDKVKSYWGGQK